jgi:hypothetical protein
MAYRLNPPPGWPPPPSDWTPPPGWRPDPAWPAPPPGWKLWVSDGPTVDTRPYSLWAIASAGVVFIGSYLPFVTSSSLFAGDIRREARDLSAMFAVLLFLSALATLWRRRQLIFAVALLVVSGLGALSYGGFIVLGQVGIESEPSPIFAYSTKVTFAPNIGILLCLGGCVAAGVCAFKLLNTLRP